MNFVVTVPFENLVWYALIMIVVLACMWPIGPRKEKKK